MGKESKNCDNQSAPCVRSQTGSLLGTCEFFMRLKHLSTLPKSHRLALAVKWEQPSRLRNSRAARKYCTASLLHPSPTISACRASLPFLRCAVFITMGSGRSYRTLQSNDRTERPNGRAPGHTDESIEASAFPEWLLSERSRSLTRSASASPL